MIKNFTGFDNPDWPILTLKVYSKYFDEDIEYAVDSWTIVDIDTYHIVLDVEFTEPLEIS